MTRLDIHQRLVTYAARGDLQHLKQTIEVLLVQFPLQAIEGDIRSAMTAANAWKHESVWTYLYNLLN